MNFSILQVSRCRIDALSSFWGKSFFSLRKSCGSGSKLVASNAYGRGHNRRWIRTAMGTQTGTEDNGTSISTVKNELLDKAATKLNRSNPKSIDISRDQYCDINKDVESLVTVMVFDIETTGFSRKNDRIIEIAMRDLGGGKNSTFQTLVNPGRSIQNVHVHGISTHMVNQNDAPRMEELIPILLQYVKSRQKPEGYVLWIAHNGRNFDVPFLRNEFSRCYTGVPENWLFVDTMPLARELMKSGVLKISNGASLRALREHYQIQISGTAHRAMADVDALSSILRRLTFDLKLTVTGLVEASFTISELETKTKQKKGST